jgi:glycosyltransferase involved in cell wall biosynthesis
MSIGRPEPARRATIWVVSEMYYPEETSTGFFLTGIAEGLASAFPVRALCGQPTYSKRGTRAPYRETRNGVRIVRAPGTTLNKDVLPFRLANMATVSASIFLHLVVGLRRADAVLVVTTPPLLPLIARAASWLRGAKCVLLVHDVYPENMIAGGLIRPRSVAARLFGALSRTLYRAVDHICVIGRDMRELVARRRDRGGIERMTVIPNWAGSDMFESLERGDNPLLAELGLAGKFVVQYAGNMGPLHAIEDLVAAAERLREINPAVHFLFIGSGAKKAWLERVVAERELSSVTVLPPRPRTEQRLFMTACDLAVTAFVPGMFGAGVPSRLYNILASGRPIVAAVDADSEIGMVIAEENAGWVTPPGDVDALVRALTEAAADPARIRQIGARGREAARAKYTSRAIMKAYTELFETMLADAR